MSNGITAFIYSANPPGKEQEEKFLAFLRRRYGEGVRLAWERESEIKGFRLVIGSDVYDWTLEGKIEQLREKITEAVKGGGDFIPLLRDAVDSWTPEAYSRELGVVETVGDGIATVKGLQGVRYGEILIFSSGIRGMAQNLKDDEVGCILFDDGEEIVEGSTVRRTKKTAGIPVGEGFLGRVVNALGVPVDGLGNIEAAQYKPVERPAPGIIDRQPVNKPLETGILAIDSMFPIGRGQRELIIGDRQTGKTAIAIDTIINQKGKDVICVYVSIGQKSSSVAQIAQTLKKHGAMDYTVIINAGASDASPLQYIAPYAGCAMGEYFMEKGMDVLIVYDDLSKHAVAYRSLSLLLGRSPGREAYPGDVFYLHSRLLERSAHLSDQKGGGSMTALPIVETQSGDVSAYIPTNIISITDGQIFLESDLFFAGQRPAVNVGLSVSRVGGDAQTKAMKSACGTLRLDLAQYREMKVFTQFSSDLDDTTRNQLIYGGGLMQMLCQPQYRPYKHHEQVILLVCALSHVLQNVSIAAVGEFTADLLEHFDSSLSPLCKKIDREGVLSQDDRKTILDEAKSFAANWRK